MRAWLTPLQDRDQAWRDSVAFLQCKRSYDEGGLSALLGHATPARAPLSSLAVNVASPRTPCTQQVAVRRSKLANVTFSTDII